MVGIMIAILHIKIPSPHDSTMPLESGRLRASDTVAFLA
jgi:hypothetical protein